jgi:cytochrome c
MCLTAAALLAVFTTAASAADVAHGKQVFASCAACHSDRADAIGPDLKGVIGRKSAALEGYRYSGPMRRANLVWDEANLKQYISDPQTKVPGNRMPFSGLHDQRDVDDVIAYLETFK